MNKIIVGLNRSIVAWFLRNTPLKDLGPEMEILAERCYRNRLANKGYVPLEIFEACIGIGGNYPCAQIIVEVVKDGQHAGYALRQRDSGEIGTEWAGMYHNVCTAVRMGETAEQVLARDFSDITGIAPAVNDLEYVGTNLQSEPERLADAVTTIWKIKVKESDVSHFKGAWKVFTDLNDPTIIDHMQAILKWAFDPDRPRFHRTFTKTC